jgi:hypothetical protein
MQRLITVTSTTCPALRRARIRPWDLCRSPASHAARYVVDGAAVPTALGVNPQITIMALATRAAEKIAATLS